MIAIIPARSGSKRLRAKNVKTFHGRPLLAYSLMVAKASPHVSHVVVSTDSASYADIARHWGADSIVYRTPEEAGDRVTTLATLTHAIRHIDAPDSHILLLQPNCPLRTDGDLDIAWQRLTCNHADALVSAEKRVFKLSRSDDPIRFQPAYQFGQPKQAMDTRWREDGNIYIFPAYDIAYGRYWPRIGAKVVALQSRSEQTLANIDTPDDFDLAEWLFVKYGYDTYFNELEERLCHSKLAI
jgi:CMP-N,N'-diacetyllegionaminic acid synthase